MQVTINTLSEVQQEAHIQLTHDELQPHFDRAYEKFRPKAEVKGFRKGKVPMPMIRQLYGEAIENDALDDIATEFYRKAMEEKNIHVIGQPTMTDMEFRRGDHLRFSIKYEVKPEISLGKYKGIPVDKPVHVVTDSELQSEILTLRRANSSTVEADAVTDAEFIVTGDVQELDESGTPLIGKKTPGARFVLSDETLAPEIRDALLHSSKGATFTVRFESKHGDHTHPVHIAIAVGKIEKVELPPFDEPLVKKITGGNVATVEEFTSKLRTDIERYWQDQSTGRLNDNIAHAIVAAHDFPVPDSLVDRVLDSLVSDLRQRSRDRKLPKNFDEGKFREESRAYALWQAKWMLLKERIAEKEKITVTDQELEALATAEAEKLGISRDRLLQYYRNSDSVADRMLSDKIMAFLRTHAKVTERLAEPAAQP
ncbi:MAG: trigger factor [Bacteroidota bacterium]